MLITTATRLGTRTQHGLQGTSGGVIPPCAALLRYREQQTRAFRFARIWASCFDPESHHDLFRHHRKLRHKYTEALNRRLSWDNHPYADDAKRMLKLALRGYWRHECWPAARYVNTAARSRTPDNPTGQRPGNNIEDAERGAMEHLLFGERSTEDWPSTFKKPKSRRRKQHTAAAMSSSSVPESQSSDVEYTIDPITNRKVPKLRKVPPVPDVASPTIFATTVPGLDMPAAPAMRYQPQFTPFNPPPVVDSQEPVFYDGPPPEAELKKYGPVKLDTHATTAAYTGQNTPVFESEEYENSHAVSDSPQTTVTWHPIDSLLSSSSHVSAHEGESVNAWTTEPDNLGYEDLDKYADSAPTPTNNQPYDDLQKYKPIGLDEDIETLQDEQQYPDLPGYDTSGFHYAEPCGSRAIENHTEAAGSEAAKYEPYQLEEDAGAVYGEFRTQPAELNEYQPFGYNEPDGRSVSAAEEAGQYEPRELQQYQAFSYNEPDGKPQAAAEERSEYDPAEVQSYQAFMYNEPDGRPLLGDESVTRVAHGSPQVSSFEADAGELRTYGAVKYNEPDGEPSERPDSTARALNDFDQEQKAGQRIPYLEPTEEERAEDLDLLRASDIRASFGMPPAEEQEAKPHCRDSLASAMSRHAAASDAADQEAASWVTEVKRKTRETEGQWVEQGRRCTGNFVRDFPEEFARSWSSMFKPEQSTGSTSSTEAPLAQPALDRRNQPSPLLQPALDRQAKLSPKPAVGDLFSKEPQGLETAYEKECAETLNDPMFVKEYGSSVDVRSGPGAADSAEVVTLASETQPTTPQEASLYKILAYDQTTQTVNIAETSSHVSKAEPALTPAEALLRLCNPAKFVPHFGPLQAEGFEIVSGSGDVLVFRKVRDRPGSSSSSSSRFQRTSASVENPLVVNPFNMTGSRGVQNPTTVRSASATGSSVNVEDDVRAMSQKYGSTVRRFVSGIDVRREEPVFSGGEKGPEGGWRDGKKEKKTSVGKRMAVGAVWVMGVSYALGVMGEYFRTGGSDGLGPRGF